MNRRISVLIVSIVFLGVALITVIPIALGPSLAPTKKDTTSSKDPSDRPANTTTSVREADERNLPVPFNYYAQNPDPDATFTSFGGIDDIGDWSYPGSPTPHKLEIGAAGGFQYPTKQDPDDPNETNYTSYDNKRRVPGEFALQLAQPDSYLVGGAPVGGLTYGWGLPDNYVSGASRTILLNWSQHDHGAYFDFDPFRQALISNPAAYKPEPYALDLTVNNTPEDFVPVYSTIDGSVIEYMGATPAGPAVENCPSGNCHGYGNFVRIRNSRWAAVNATAMYVDNNPTLCRDGAPGRVAGYTYVTSPSTVDPNKCVTGLLTDDKCEVTCTTLDTTGAVVGVPETTTNQLYKEARKSCMVDVEAGQFRNSDPSLPNGGVGSYLDTYAVKVTNYEIVLGYLTNGSVDKFFNPDGSDQSKAITNQGQVGTLGHSGFYWDTATSQYLPNTDRPMLHYEVYYNQNCHEFGESPNTLLTPLDQTKELPAAVVEEIQNTLATTIWNIARAEETAPTTVGTPAPQPVTGAGDNASLPLCPKEVWQSQAMQNAMATMGKIKVGKSDIYPDCTLTTPVTFNVNGRALKRDPYAPRLAWQLVDMAGEPAAGEPNPHAGMTLSISMGDVNAYEYFRLHGQAIPNAGTFGPVDYGTGPIEMKPNDAKNVYFQIEYDGKLCGELAVDAEALRANALDTKTEPPFAGRADTCIAYAGIDETPGAVAFGNEPAFSGQHCFKMEDWSKCSAVGGSVSVDDVDRIAGEWFSADSIYYKNAIGKQEVKRYWNDMSNSCSNSNLGIMTAIWLKESLASNRYIPNPEFGAWRQKDIIALIAQHNAAVQAKHDATPPTLDEAGYKKQFIILPPNFMLVMTADFGMNVLKMELEDDFVQALITLLIELQKQKLLLSLPNGELYIGPYENSGLDYTAEPPLNVLTSAVSDAFFETQLKAFTTNNYFFKNQYPNAKCETLVKEFCGKSCPDTQGSCLDYGEEIANSTMWKIGTCQSLNDIQHGAAYLENLALVFGFLDTGCCFPDDFSSSTCPSCAGGGATPASCVPTPGRACPI